MKSQLLSKTVWFNIIMLLLFVVQMLDATVLNVFGITATLSAKIIAATGLVSAVGNYILRVFFTSTPLTETAIKNK